MTQKKAVYSKPFKLHYIAGARYNTIDERNDSIKVNTFRKKNYISVHHHYNAVIIYNSLNGQLILFDPEKESQDLLNLNNALDFAGRTGFAFDFDHYYFTDAQGYLSKYDKNFTLICKVKLPVPVSAFTLAETDLYCYDRSSNLLTTFSYDGNEVITTGSFGLQGIGNKNLCIHKNELWVADEEENLVSVYDLKTGTFIMSMLTPFISPVGIAVIHNDIFIAYNGIVTTNSFDNISWQEQKPFLHKLAYTYTEANGKKQTLSNSFVVEFTYEETINLQSPGSGYKNLVTELALPVEDERQQILDIKPIGLPYKLFKRPNGHKFAEFNLGDIDLKSSGVIGYKATLKLSGIKFQVETNPQISQYDYISVEVADAIKDDSDLEMGSCYMKNFASMELFPGVIESVKTIRNKVFRALYYRENPYARNLEDVIRDGYGACGDYTSIIMACCRLNRIPVRSASGFKVPRFTNAQHESLSMHYNHSWLEFYLPGIGWLPFESSSDDIEYEGRLCESQFMGEDWSHVKIYNDRSVPNFIRCYDNSGEVHPYDLFSNNIYFKVLGETEV